jgi:hypothetical protein
MGSEDVPLLDLPLPANLPITFRASANLIIESAKADRWDVISNFAGKSTPFADILNLKSIQDVMANSTFSYPEETKYAARRVTLIGQTIRKSFISTLKSNLTSNQYQKVASLVLAKE